MLSLRNCGEVPSLSFSQRQLKFSSCRLSPNKITDKIILTLWWELWVWRVSVSTVSTRLRRRHKGSCCCGPRAGARNAMNMSIITYHLWSHFNTGLSSRDLEKVFTELTWEQTDPFVAVRLKIWRKMSKWRWFYRNKLVTKPLNPIQNLLFTSIDKHKRRLLR